MQIGSDQLLRQQLILQLKGFYKGALDGIWGPKTIEAMKKWESSGFTPGLPSGGMPLANKGPWPKGVRKDSDGLLTTAEVEQHLAAQSKSSKSKTAEATQAPEKAA